MSIKKSVLNQKWYYRLARVFFIILPFAAMIFIFSKKGILNPEILQNNASQVLQNNINFIVYSVVGVIAYFVALNLIWKIVVYIIFGGLENDSIKKNGQVVDRSAGQGSLSEEDKKQVGFYLSILIIIAIIYYAYFIWKPTGIIKNDINSVKNSKCISTGCGSQWYCNGTYYEDGLQKRVNGCLSKKAGEIYSSWSGTCRQCP